MTDEHDSAPDPVYDPGDSLDPVEDARVRALLADLGSGSADPPAMPAEVVARLDATLAALADARTEQAATPTSTSNVVPLRRKGTRRLAAAAAAVIVVGVGGVAVTQLGGGAGSSDTADSTAAGGQAEKSTDDVGGGGDQPPSSADSGAGDPPGDAANGLSARRLPKLGAASFEADVAALLRRAPRATAAQSDTSSGRSESRRNYAGVGCPGPAVGRARHRTVLYDGSPAALVVHPVADGRRLVEAWTCSGERRLASADLEAAGAPD